MKLSKGQISLVAAILIAMAWSWQLLGGPPWGFNILMTISAVLAGWPIAKNAWAALKFKTFGIELLVTVAVTGALLIGEYWEAAAVTFLFIFGSYLEAKTLEKTRSSLKSLMDLSPLYAVIVRDGQEVKVSPEEVPLGERVLVRPGEKIPVDGTVIKGSASVNQAAITGESIPVEINTEDTVFSGTVVESGYLEIEAEKVGADTTFARILDLVEEAQEAKAPTQQFMERFATYYTPGIMILSLIVLAVTRDIKLTLTLLVIACPGALVISVPVSIVAGIGNAAKRGLLIKGGQVLEKAGRLDVIAFDKTGTLTRGQPQVVEVYPVSDASAEQLVSAAARAEVRSEHHLARAIIDYAERNGIEQIRPADEFEHVPGMGVTAMIDGREVLVGSRKLMAQRGITVPDEIEQVLQNQERIGRTAVIVADENRVLGVVAVADVIRDDAHQLMSELKELGIKKTLMLTGDNERTAAHVANTLGIDAFEADLLPEEKVETIRRYQALGYKVGFVGDGVNDAPSLAAADLGIAMGGTGTDVAIETADIVLASGNFERLGYVLDLSRATVRNVKQNIFFAVAVVSVLLVGVLAKVVFLASGMLVHELSVLAVIINATRLLSYERRQPRRSTSLGKVGGKVVEV